MKPADDARWARGAALVLVAFLGLVLDIALGSTPTVDEFADVPAGLAILAASDYRLDLRNPPLIKALVALPALALDARLPPASFRQASTGWWPWVHGTRFLRDNPERYRAIFIGARAVVAVLAAVLGWLVFSWARECHDGAGGLLALALYALCPTVLAHASLATLDIGAALFFFAAALALHRHLEHHSWPALAAASLLCGLALASKFSTVLLLPAFAAALVIRLPGTAAARLGAAAWRLGAIGLGVLAVLQAAYGFPGLTSLADLGLKSPAGRTLQAGIGSWPLPLPAEFALGFDDALAYARAPEIPGYLNGVWSTSGWWYYHLEAFALKEPLPLLLLLVLAAFSWSARPRPPLLLVLPPLLLLVSLLTWNRVQYGLRYALPIYPFLFVLASRVATVGRLRRIVLALVLALAAATLAIHPHELSYFNRIGGGPENGWRWLADSNLDWGQDLDRLAMKLRADYPGRTVKLAYFGHVDPAYHGIRYQVLTGRQDATGLVAVSASYLAGEPYAITWRGMVPEPVAPGVHAWLQRERPVGRVGYSIYLYELPEPAAGAHPGGGVRARARAAARLPAGALPVALRPGPGR